MMLRHTSPLLLVFGLVTFGHSSTAEDLDEALVVAAAAGREKDVASLLDQGADINTLSEKDGWSALSLASENGHLATVRLLVERGARVDQVVNQELTALQRAVSARHLDVVRFLMQHGAGIHTRRAGGRTLLMDATDAFYSDREAQAVGIVTTFLAGGIDINATDTGGYTALMLAVQEGQAAMVEVLLKNGADVNLRGRDGKSALDVARDRKQSKIAALLQRAGESRTPSAQPRE